MTAFSLRVEGPPTGKARPRFNPKTSRTYTPAKTRTAEARIMVAWETAGRPTMPDGPVQIRVELALARPASHWKVNGDLSAAGQRSRWPTKKPDADNVLKLVMDALNGCAYHDDAAVVVAWVVKRWADPGEREHTLITVTPASGADLALRKTAA